MKTRRPFGLLVLSCLLLAGCTAHRRTAGTGDVAFRLLWDGLSDLDLAVQDPAGECISFIAPRSASGGILDIDCNGSTEHTCEYPIENIFWPAAQAPPGEYRVFVNVHALIPFKVPVAFELQVLRGQEVSWRHRGTFQETEQAYSPFVYRFPEGKAATRLQGEAAALGCGGGLVFREGRSPTP